MLANQKQEDNAAGLARRIGCDGMGCGLCPIIGRRYRCLDCPERMGFDLCGKCYDHNLQHPNLVGRFNQSHKPGR